VPTTSAERVVNVIQPLNMQGTNSTMFTACCQVAICDRELCCPRCGVLVIGYDAASDHERGRIRWDYATALWKKRGGE